MSHPEGEDAVDRVSRRGSTWAAPAWPCSEGTVVTGCRRLRGPGQSRLPTGHDHRIGGSTRTYRAVMASAARTVARLLLGAAMVGAGVLHLTTQRQEFQAQVPDWFPVDPDLTVLASGVVEITLGAAFVALPRRRRLVGALLAAFFVLVFPGNVAQYVEGTDAFGLDTDRKRLVRLFFQPVLVLLALFGGGWWQRTRHH
ncbi:Uncharacterized membrane protein [Geodermatophilus obscurus]|uniref:Uncharacterized membrane protein n=2 Tax=Geodermatophilus obscurus TaxID=1861 RepID=A0A1I5IMZ2_9ACTN|nr:Uncharacterized membrane protein [Geodermatophilus obscurus]